LAAKIEQDISAVVASVDADLTRFNFTGARQTIDGFIRQSISRGWLTMAKSHPAGAFRSLHDGMLRALAIVFPFLPLTCEHLFLSMSGSALTLRDTFENVWQTARRTHPSIAGMSCQ
jgi:valyl-tRNA synthetase